MCAATTAYWCPEPHFVSSHQSYTFVRVTYECVQQLLRTGAQSGARQEYAAAQSSTSTASAAFSGSYTVVWRPAWTPAASPTPSWAASLAAPPSATCCSPPAAWLLTLLTALPWRVSFRYANLLFLCHTSSKSWLGTYSPEKCT